MFWFIFIHPKQCCVSGCRSVTDGCNRRRASFLECIACYLHAHSENVTFAQSSRRCFSLFATAVASCWKWRFTRTNAAGQAFQRKVPKQLDLSRQGGCVIWSSAPEGTTPLELHKPLILWPHIWRWGKSSIAPLTMQFNTNACWASDCLCAPLLSKSIRLCNKLLCSVRCPSPTPGFYRTFAPHLCWSVFSHLNVPSTQPSTDPAPTLSAYLILCPASFVVPPTDVFIKMMSG